VQLPGHKEEMLALLTSKDHLVPGGKVSLEGKDAKELKTSSPSSLALQGI